MLNTSTNLQPATSTTPVIVPGKKAAQPEDAATTIADSTPTLDESTELDASTESVDAKEIDTTKSAFARDKQDFSKNKPTTLEYLLHALKESGRNPFSLAWEYLKLNRQKGRITFPEYVQFGLYDSKMPYEQKERYISNLIHWPVTMKCCDMTWQAATEDKWLCSKILQDTPALVPETLAVIDKTARSYPGTTKISTVDEFRKFALANRDQPFFGKENRGMISFGVFLVLEADENRVNLKGEGWIDYESFMEKYVGKTTYLIQKCQSNHKFFDKYTDALATIRISVLVTDDGVKTPFAALKLPACGQIADSFWRPGNIACNIDPANGRILDARTKNHLETKSFDKHPACDEILVGETLPQWDAVLNIVQECAQIFAPVRYQSMDIAITDQGPVLIEINTGGGFDLLQLASGEGMLTDEVSDFFKSHGCRRF